MSKTTISESEFEEFLQSTHIRLADRTFPFMFNRFDWSKIDRKSILFIGCEFQAGFQIFGLDVDFAIVEFHECDFGENGIYVSECSGIDSWNFRHCTIDTLQMSSTKAKRLLLDSCQVGTCRFFGFKSDEFYCTSQEAGLMQELTMYKVDIKEYNFWEIYIERIFVHNIGEANLTLPPFGSLTVGSETFGSLIIGDFPGDIPIKLINLSHVVKGKLIIRNLNLQSLIMREVSIDDGQFLISNCQIATAVIDNSNLSKLNLFDVSFKEIEMTRSHLTDITLSNVKWPAAYFIYTYSTGRENYGIAHFQYMRENYRQLKVLATQNQNEIDALAFYRNEMDCYWQEVKLSKSISWWNRLIIWSNRAISDFGQNWQRPLAILLVSHFVFYAVYLYLNHGNTLAYFTWESFEHAFGQYFELFIPFRKLDADINGYSKLPLFLMHIFDALFVYHFLKATRKYRFG